MARRKKESLDRAAGLITAECIAARTRLLGRTITGIYDDALRPHGLTVGQLNILAVLARRGPMPAADIARRLNIEKSTVSRNVQRMNKNGWLAAMVVGAGHGRPLTLSKKGEALITNALPAWEEAQDRAKALLGQRGADSIHSVGNFVLSQLASE